MDLFVMAKRGHFLRIAALLFLFYGAIKASTVNPKNPNCLSAFGDGQGYKCVSDDIVGFQCVSSDDLCDGASDCLYGESDEDNCAIGAAAFNESCQIVSSHFIVKCFSNAQCISESDICDGNNDCIDGSDEINCLISDSTTADGDLITGETCPDLYDDSCIIFLDSLAIYKCPNEFKCIQASKLCDKFSDCEDGIDEEICCAPNDDSQVNITAEEQAFESALCQLGFPDKIFQCSSNTSYIQCVSAEDICNAVKECADGSDELDCELRSAKIDEICSNASAESPVLCFTGSHCISEDNLCNGIEDCADGSDEYRCGITTLVQTTTRIPRTIAAIRSTRVPTTALETSTKQSTGATNPPAEKSSTSSRLTSPDLIPTSPSIPDGELLSTNFRTTGESDFGANSEILSLGIQGSYNYGGWTKGMCFSAVMTSESLDLASLNYLWEIKEKYSSEASYCVALAPTENIIVKLTVKNNSTTDTAMESFSNNGWELILVVTVIPVSFTVALFTGITMKYFKYTRLNTKVSPLDGI